MKIFYSPPKMTDIFKHDSALLSIVSTATVAFILLSSATVFTGLALHFDLTGARLLTYGAVVYPVACLAPDLVNLAAWTYIVRTLLKWRDLEANTTTTAILLLFCLALSGFATWYSFQMSQVSAEQIAEKFKPDPTDDGLAFDTTLMDKLNGVLAIDSTKTNQADQVLNLRRGSAAAVFNNQIAALVRDSLQYEKKRHRGNTEWIDKKLQPVVDQLAGLRYQRDTTINNLVGQYATTAGESADLKTNVNKMFVDYTAGLLEDNKAERDAYNRRHKLIGFLLSSVAGFAVIILLALGAVREILYHRNEIEPAPIVGAFDFQNFAQIKEVALLPVTVAGRHIINAVRRAYHSLPELEKPALERYEIDYTTLRAKVVKFDQDDGLNIAATANDQKPLLHQLRDRERNAPGTGASFTEHENTNEIRVISDTKTGKDFTRTDLLQKLNMYQKRYAKHVQKKIKHERKNEQVPKRTLDAVENNAGWIQHYSELINDLENK